MTGRIIRIPAAVLAMAAALAASAQAPTPPVEFPVSVASPPPDYGTTPAPAPEPFPPAVMTAPEAVPFVPGATPRTSIRQIFAGTLAAAANVTGMTLVAGLTQAITGGLTNWFSRRTNPQPAAVPGQPAAEPQTVPAGYASPGMPPDTPAVASPYAAPVYAAPAAAVPSGYAAPDTPAGAPLYAGIAYEVHAIAADGGTLPVDPATHEFRTGERFVVHYRPALPGRMEVYNINAAGQQTQIDSAELAAGQLATLGPYEFASLKGDEQLRLVLTPCTRPELVIATRDIVKVSASAPVQGAALGLATCGPATRSIRGQPTRDIRKVALDGSTAFALDPVSAEEYRKGQLAPREVTIVFHHR